MTTVCLPSVEVKRVKLPAISVCVANLVPLTVTVTPCNGVPDSSVIFPLICFCCAIDVIAKQQNNNSEKNFLIMAFKFKQSQNPPKWTYKSIHNRHGNEASKALYLRKRCRHRYQESLAKI